MINIFIELYQSVVKLLLPLKTNETYAMIANEAAKLMRSDYGAIYIDKDGALQQAFSNAPVKMQVTPRRRGYAYRAFKTGKPVILNQKKMSEGHPEFIKNVKNISSVALIPLTNDKISIGILSLISTKNNYFNKQKLLVLQLFGSMASLAIRKTQLYDDLKHALESRDLFIAMAAHELKTPLTTISGYAQMINLKKQELSHPEWSDELNKEIKRLSRLINELMRIEQIKSGKFSYDFKECQMSDILKKAITEFKYNNPSSHVIFKNSIKNRKDTIIGDQDKLLQALINVLNNAEKYSPPGKPIVIKLAFSTSHFIIKIQDEGIGIDRKDIPHLFEKYYRSSDTGKKEGMGLGLYLVKEIINHHHGQIRIFPNDIRGTTVEIKLLSNKL